MAGFILHIGEKRKSLIHEMNRTFKDIKGLSPIYEYSNNKIQLVKFRRKFSKDDSNLFISDELIICATGTILYKNHEFEDSIRKIGQDIVNSRLHLENIADEIDGHFFLIVFSIVEDRLLFITDAGGVINTYFLQDNNDIYISSSLITIAKYFPVTLDEKSILLFMRTGIFFGDSTYFNEIKTLEAASIYKFNFQTEKITKSYYWEAPKTTNDSITFNDSVQKITNSLTKIIRKIPTKNAIYDFTGGYDARFVVALAYNIASQKKESLNTFFFGPRSSREAKIVEKNCRNLGMLYNNFELPNNWPNQYYDYFLESTGLCDGMENSCAYASILYVNNIKGKKYHYTVHGLQGELYRERTWEFEFGKRGKKQPANFERVIKYRNLADDFDQSIFVPQARVKIDAAHDHILKIYRETNEIFNNDTPNTLQLDYSYLAHRARKWAGRTVTTTNQLLQPICPLWFKEPLSHTLSLPPTYRKNCKLIRTIVEKESYSLAKEKMINGAPLLQKKLINVHLFLPSIKFLMQKIIRKIFQILFNKTIWAGLTVPDYDTGIWFRQALKDHRCMELLDWDKMLSKNFYNKNAFEKFVTNAHSSNFHFYGQLGNILTIEQTLRMIGFKK